MAVSQRGDSLDSDEKHGVFHSTPGTGRELHLVTTAPPFTDLNHHLQFKTFSQPDPHYQSPEQFKESRELDHHLFKALSAQMVPHEVEEPRSDVTTGAERSGAAGETQRQSAEELSTEALITSIMPTSSPPPCHTVPEEQLEHPHAATTQETEGVTTLVMREEKSKRHRGPTTDANSMSGDQDDETTTTTIFTTTIITTIQTPGNTTCTTLSQQNLINMPVWNMPLTKCSVIVQHIKQRGERQTFFFLCHHTNARVLLAVF